MVIPIDLEPKGAVHYDIVLDTLPQLRFDTKVAIVTNPTVAGYHLETLLSRIDAPTLEVIEVPDGESFKTIETVLSILDRMFEARFDRKSILIAFGGGVIGDMTGFSASIYQRGVDFIQIPTTLLSQVDASVGGKTGVNNRFGKNLIGTFYQPKAVYIDIAFLKTLPKREFAAGVAEIIKMAVMFDETFFTFLENADLAKREDLQEAIRRSVELKAEVVNRDEKEQGVRAVLNYGHTFGHVIEAQTAYETYLHGEAVAIGMVMANRLACELALLSPQEAKRIEALLRRYDLPTNYNVDDPRRFYEHFFLDKKTQKGKLSFILPAGIGKHTIKRDIPQNKVLQSLAYFTKEGRRKG